ncbi:MAG: hypothetical protein ABSH06_23795 [Thermodesulfobacteriota bacterium]|jgi:hypothetical protein
MLGEKKVTLSEQKFEEFCKTNGIPLERVAPEERETPDYDVWIDGQRIVVEVKQLEMNEEDARVVHEFQTSRRAFGGVKRIGDRVRYKIDKAKRQIENRTQGKHPTILVLYDTRPTLIRGINPYEILVAMYGFEAIDLHVPDKMGDPVRFGKHRFGKGKKVSPNSHTYISALGLLSEHESTGQLHLNIYLNVFADADKPLPLEAMVNSDNISVFTIPSEPTNEFREWARIEPAKP